MFAAHGLTERIGGWRAGEPTTIVFAAAGLSVAEIIILRVSLRTTSTEPGC